MAECKVRSCCIFLTPSYNEAFYLYSLAIVKIFLSSLWYLCSLCQVMCDHLRVWLLPMQSWPPATHTKSQPSTSRLRIVPSRKSNFWTGEVQSTAWTSMSRTTLRSSLLARTPKSWAVRNSECLCTLNPPTWHRRPQWRPQMFGSPEHFPACWCD